MRLGTLTRPELIFPGLQAPDRPQLLRLLAERIAASGLVKSADELYQRLWEREQIGSTGIGSGIAIPHCKLKGLARGVVAIGTVPEGVDFGAVDGRPVRLVFLVITPLESPAEHLQVLAAISRWIKADRHAEGLLSRSDPKAIQQYLEQEGG